MVNLSPLIDMGHNSLDWKPLSLIVSVAQDSASRASRALSYPPGSKFHKNSPASSPNSLFPFSEKEKDEDIIYRNLGNNYLSPSKFSGK